jgi:3-oxoacyl-[acyl-carrier-protein] synthase II
MIALRSGRLDVALVGGSEAMLTPGVLSTWNALRVLASPEDKQRACRPFNKDRSGFALGEGAAAFVLETLEHAKARQMNNLSHQPHPQLFLIGYASNCDAFHITNPSVDGQIKVMESALEDAGIGVDQIDYINAHATGTLVGDEVEGKSVYEVFGPTTAISSCKAQYGHLLGASGALELVATLRGMQTGILPPNANLNDPDESFKLNFVDKVGQSKQIRNAISNSFAFGGTNASLIVSYNESNW